MERRTKLGKNRFSYEPCLQIKTWTWKDKCLMNIMCFMKVCWYKCFEMKSWSWSIYLPMICNHHPILNDWNVIKWIGVMFMECSIIMCKYDKNMGLSMWRPRFYFDTNIYYMMYKHKYIHIVCMYQCTHIYIGRLKVGTYFLFIDFFLGHKFFK